jgi:hypothetical protein
VAQVRALAQQKAFVVAWFVAKWWRQADAEFLAAQAAGAAERAATSARADEQHRQVLRGDKRGTLRRLLSGCLTVRLLVNAVEVAENGAIGQATALHSVSPAARHAVPPTGGGPPSP